MLLLLLLLFLKDIPRKTGMCCACGRVAGAEGASRMRAEIRRWEKKLGWEAGGTMGSLGLGAKKDLDLKTEPSPSRYYVSLFPPL